MGLDSFSEEMLNEINRKCWKSYHDFSESTTDVVNKFQVPLIESIIFPVISNACQIKIISSDDKQEIKKFLIYKSNQMGYLCLLSGFESTTGTITEDTVPFFTYLFSYYYRLHITQSISRLMPLKELETQAGIQFFSQIQNSITHSSTMLAHWGVLLKNSIHPIQSGDSKTPFQLELMRLDKKKESIFENISNSL